MLDIFKEKSYIEVWESDLSKFVSEFYGRPWRMQQGEMIGNDSYREVRVDASDEVDGFCGDYPGELTVDGWLALPFPCPDPCPNNTGGYKPDTSYYLSMHWERDHYISCDLIMNDLCKKNIIEPGNYLIKIWW